MRLQSAIFDMDGVLVDSMWVWRDLIDNFLQSQGHSMTEAMWEETKTMGIQQTADYFRTAFSLPQSTEEMCRLWQDQIRDFYTNRVQAKPGVERALSLLKMEGVWMYIATATERPLVEAALNHTGLKDYFRGFVTCGEAGAGKSESPAVYERCLTRLRSNKADTVIFEDSLQAIRTAKAAGFRVAGIYDADSEQYQDEIREICDYYFRSFEEFFEEKTL